MNMRWKVLNELDVIGTSVDVPAMILTMKIGGQSSLFFDILEFEVKSWVTGDIVTSNSRKWWRRAGVLSFVKC